MEFLMFIPLKRTEELGSKNVSEKAQLKKVV